MSGQDESYSLHVIVISHSSTQALLLPLFLPSYRDRAAYPRHPYFHISCSLSWKRWIRTFNSRVSDSSFVLDTGFALGSQETVSSSTSSCEHTKPHHSAQKHGGLAGLSTSSARSCAWERSCHDFSCYDIVERRSIIAWTTITTSASRSPSSASASRCKSKGLA